MVLIKLLPILGTFSGKTVKLMVLALIFLFSFFFNDPATTDIYTFPYTTLFRSHRAGHGGAFPDDLDALVPEILPAVPLDTLAGGGKRLGYVNDPKRPRIYNVGENGVDDGGTDRKSTRLNSSH